MRPGSARPRPPSARPPVSVGSAGGGGDGGGGGAGPGEGGATNEKGGEEEGEEEGEEAHDGGVLSDSEFAARLQNMGHGV
jgi:hypothetical protein